MNQRNRKHFIPRNLSNVWMDCILFHENSSRMSFHEWIKPVHHSHPPPPPNSYRIDVSVCFVHLCQRRSLSVSIMLLFQRHKLALVILKQKYFLQIHVSWILQFLQINRHPLHWFSLSECLLKWCLGTPGIFVLKSSQPISCFSVELKPKFQRCPSSGATLMMEIEETTETSILTQQWHR
jgi:hypothetical protein